MPPHHQWYLVPSLVGKEHGMVLNGGFKSQVPTLPSMLRDEARMLGL